MAVVEKNLDRSELANLVASDTGLSKDDVQRMLQSFFSNLRTGVALTGYAELDGLGSFKLVTRAARKGVSPSGQAYSVPTRLTIKFEAFQPFREEVAAKNGKDCI